MLRILLAFTAGFLVGCYCDYEYSITGNAKNVGKIDTSLKSIATQHNKLAESHVKLLESHRSLLKSVSNIIKSQIRIEEKIKAIDIGESV